MKFIAALVLVLLALSAIQASEISSCSICRGGCLFLKSADQTKCNAICEATVCAGLFSDSEVARTVRKCGTMMTYRKYDTLSEEEAEFDKCKVCKTGCLFLNSQNQPTCNAVCESTVCSGLFSDQESNFKIGKTLNKIGKGIAKGFELYQKYKPFIPLESEEFVDLSIFQKVDKCKVCKAGCLFVNSKYQQKCDAVCDATVCSGLLEDEQVLADKINWGKLKDKVWGFMKNHKCQICNASCVFMKDGTADKCKQLCSVTVCA